MVWRIEFLRSAERDLNRLDRPVRRRILSFLHGRLASTDNPRSLGAALRGSEMGELWRYRVGDWRIVAQIEDNTMRILVVRIDHRRDVYRLL